MSKTPNGAEALLDRREVMKNAQKGVLTDEMKRMIAALRLCYVATVTPEGKPNLSPKGTLKVWDDEHLVFADIASPGTIENLKHNPFTEVNIVDPFLRRGYRFKGRAEILTDPDIVAFAGSDLGNTYPVRAAIKVRVEEAFPVRSPVYIYHKIPEKDLKNLWMRIYGYREASSSE